MKRSPVFVLLVGLTTSLALAIIGWLFMNPEPCPAAFTQQEIDASRCVIGANIGLGLMLMLAVTTALITTIMAIALTLPDSLKKKLFRFL